MYNSLSQKVFAEIIERTTVAPDGQIEPDEGIVTSLDEFISLVVESANTYFKVNATPEKDQIVVMDDFPRDLFSRINNNTHNTNIDDTTMRDIRVVTYTADEQPATLSAHAPDAKGIRNIKPRLKGIYDDPKYTGYSVIRLGKDIEAVIDFQVWGIDARDIRARAKLLRNIIQQNTWYYKKKGLREIIWLGSMEAEMWDKLNLVKMKREKYLVRYSEIQETREKNIEQVIVQFGLS